jgi:type II secretory pathway pseudopilin PulG
MSTLARQPGKPVGAVGETGTNGDGQGGQGMAQAARRASMGQQEPFHQEYQRQQPSIQQQEQFQQQQQVQHQQQQQQQQSQLQAQRMYPNHPLLNSTSPNVPLQQWVPTSAPMTDMYGSPIDTYSNPILSAPPAGGFDIGRSGSMRMSSSDMGASSSSMGRMESGSSVGSYDYGYKKKACDQCNHSKVKCDFTYPCGKSLPFQYM